MLKRSLSILVIMIIMVMSSCSPEFGTGDLRSTERRSCYSDPTRPDLAKKAKKVQRERLKQYGPYN